MQPFYVLSAFLLATVMALPLNKGRSEVLTERQDLDLDAALAATDLDADAHAGLSSSAPSLSSSDVLGKADGRGKA
ncbi:hypothetical protein BDV40DRAFT_298532 [Aspergillus tamarii]|uniref:Uncharacterized protein n=1 Tax=Aspergillus tamarii TaxID=41984 RepID=A0A5N6V2J0_ASPTM|nr:hypothetical protein BDV40DRAFT_298532 [Aspergillus tamarii]